MENKIKDSNDNYVMTKGAGFNHDGSLRALKMEKEANSAAFELDFTNLPVNFPGASEHRKINAFIRLRFSFEIWPRTVTSTEKW